MYFTDPLGAQVKYTELNFELLDIQSKAFLSPDKNSELKQLITTKFSPLAVVKIFICYLHFDIPLTKNLFLELFYWNFTKKVYFVVLKMKLCMGYLS